MDERGDMENHGLKPCPFCGDTAAINESEEGADGLHEIWIISCDTCQAEMRGNRLEQPSYINDAANQWSKDIYQKYMEEKFERFGKDEKEDLIKSWNKRV